MSVSLEKVDPSVTMPQSAIRLSVRQLKDTIQLSLLQQSEYLRRFSLVFCRKVTICTAHLPSTKGRIMN